MTNVPFALSVHTLLNSAGADAGFAAIVGLAILVLLHFAQARETATLRHRLDEADDHVQALEAHLDQLQRAQATAPARPAVAPRPVIPGAAPVPGVGEISASRVSHPAPIPAAPVGTAAPALAAATRLIPLPGPAPAEMAPAAAEVTPVPAAAPAAPAAAPAVVPAATGAAPGTTSVPNDDTILAVPAPATAAAANGRSQGAPVAPLPPPVGPPRLPSRPNGSGPAAGSRAASSRPLISSRAPAVREPSLARRLVPVLIGLGAVAVIVVALLVLTRGGNSTTTVHNSARISGRHHHRSAAIVDPASVTVAVLNGTGVTNLAHDVATQLSGQGYKEGTIATAADQTHPTTIVAYLPGHQVAARAVATALKLKSSAVQPIDQQAMGVACPVGGTSSTAGTSSTSSGSSCAADVVVTVGSDLAGAANSSSAAG